VPNCAGRLLVAPPQLSDPNFAGAVVLVLMHDDNGAFGLVLNDSIDDNHADPDELVPEWAARITRPILRGGPVQTDAIMGLGEPVPGHHVDGFTVLGSAPQPLGAVDLSREPSGGLSRVRLFAGYSGWAPMQLEGELALGGWVVVDAHPDDAYTDDIAGLWSRVIRRQAGAHDPLAFLPDDLSLN
jgi:putative transcriptional regulator